MPPTAVDGRSVGPAAGDLRVDRQQLVTHGGPGAVGDRSSGGCGPWRGADPDRPARWPRRSGAARDPRWATATRSDRARRGRRPARRGATTGTPDASASCTDWQKVSSVPGCTKTSNDAIRRARSSPRRKPRNWAPGSVAAKRSRSGPSPMTTSRAAGRSDERREEVDALLGGETTDVADERLALGGQDLAHGRRSVVGVKPLEVDAAGPEPHRTDAVAFEAPRRQGRRGQGDRGMVVDPAQPGPNGRASEADAVAGGEPSQIGLEHRDGGHPPPTGDHRDGRAEDRGGGEVDHVGPEAPEGVVDGSMGQADLEGSVHRQRKRRHPDHRRPAVLVGTG